MQAKIIEIVEVTDYVHDSLDSVAQPVPRKRYFLANGSPLVLESSLPQHPASPSVDQFPIGAYNKSKS